MKSHIENCFDLINEVYAVNQIANLPAVKAAFIYAPDQITPMLHMTKYNELEDFLKPADGTFPLLTCFGIFWSVFDGKEVVVKRVSSYIGRTYTKQPTTHFCLNPNYLPPFILPCSGFPQTMKESRHVAIAWYSLTSVIIADHFERKLEIKSYNTLF